MKDRAMAADGHIEPGDMLLQVNEINSENMSNDDAVQVLREIVRKPGSITPTSAGTQVHVAALHYPRVSPSGPLTLQPGSLTLQP
ncbi:hypothetical protein U0070_010250 [Myodes glareolus]|uniref:PDZ domain-containing protein n=1 Tax=Myodes glareolus TaxID=447135 RepID=A0AAW0H098_MYOGA